LVSQKLQYSPLQIIGIGNSVADILAVRMLVDFHIGVPHLQWIPSIKTEVIVLLECFVNFKLGSVFKGTYLNLVISTNFKAVQVSEDSL